MGYEKRIAVLKQIGAGYQTGDRPVAGIFKIENYAGRTEAEVSLLGARPGTFPAAVLCADGQSYRFLVQNPIKTRAQLPACPDFSNGAACLILSDDGFDPVAFGVSGLFNCSVVGMRDVFLQSAEKKDGEQPPEKRSSAPVAQSPSLPITEPVPEPLPVTGPPDAPPVPSNKTEGDLTAEQQLYQIYQDEVVASENYFLMPDVDMQTLSLVESQQTEQEKESGEIENHANVAPARSDSAEDAGGQKEQSVRSDAADAVAVEKHDDRVRGRYYQTVEGELETLFSAYPAEHVLQQNVPDSRWVRVTAADGRYYVVGVIEQGGLPAYICYGVPGKYQKDPPKELAGYCSYLPLSLFDMHGEGYWMMFQDADTGECSHVDFA